MFGVNCFEVVFWKGLDIKKNRRRRRGATFASFFGVFVCSQLPSCTIATGSRSSTAAVVVFVCYMCALAFSSTNPLFPFPSPLRQIRLCSRCRCQRR
jgi:hypothetical protein